MRVLIPLKSDEEAIFRYKDHTYSLKPNECIKPFGEEFFAEIGKYYTFTQTDQFKEALNNNEDIALIQNTKTFNDLEDLKIENDNDIILCRAQHFSSLEWQFKVGHPEAAWMFDEVVKMMKVPKEIVTMNHCSFHNMCVAKPILIKQYMEFLIELLMTLYKPTYTKKYGAYLAERILNFWCIMNNKHIIEKDFSIFKKL